MEIRYPSTAQPNERRQSFQYSWLLDGCRFVFVLHVYEMAFFHTDWMVPTVTNLVTRFVITLIKGKDPETKIFVEF